MIAIISINYNYMEKLINKTIFAKSGIHIKPENKGKFTETMKRTGKSARELLHSKNPLTRKRAQFAINSRKWKHFNGGELIYFNN